MSCKTSYPIKHLEYKMDFHLHTQASDGFYRPAEVIRLASEKGLSMVAITDHDTTLGLTEAENAAKIYGLDFIPGLELSTLYGHQEIHILGYYIDASHPLLQKTLAGLAENRMHRAKEMVSKLQGLGHPITLEEIQIKAANATVGRTHVALVLKDKGITQTIQEGFHTFLNPGRPAYVARLKLTPHEAIALIKEAGGLSVIAHPGREFPLEILPALIKDGLQGLEVYHPRHSPETTQFYLKLTKKRGLLIMGGSDFHGHEARDLARLGSMPIPEETVLRLHEYKRLQNETRK